MTASEPTPGTPSLHDVEFESATAEERTQWYRTVFGEYPTGVAIVSALDREGRPQGLIVGTFASVSIEPPLVTFMPMRRSRAYTAMKDAERFRVNVLGAGHEDLCRSFTSAAPEERFDFGDWEFDAYGIPRLVDSLVWIDCLRTSTIPAGDHDIVLGEVQRLGFGEGSSGMPLVFLKGGYGSVALPRLEFDSRHLGSHLRVADRMSDTVQALAEEADALVTLCSLAQDAVVVLAAANVQARPSIPRPVGGTFPFAAPLGAVFAAWGSAARVAAWRTAGRRLGFTDDAGVVVETMLAQVRERGFAVSVGPAMAHRFGRTVTDPRIGPAGLRELWAAVARDYTEIGEADWHAHVSSIQVPVFGASPEPTLALVVDGLRPTRGRTELERVADRCQDVARELSTLIEPETHMPV